MPVASDAEETLAWGKELAIMKQALEELNTKERRIIRAVYDLSLRDDSGRQARHTTRCSSLTGQPQTPRDYGQTACCHAPHS